MIQAALRQAESLFDHLQVQNRAPRHVGRLVSHDAGMLEVTGFRRPIGSGARVLASDGSICRAEVVGFRGDRPLLVPLDADAPLENGIRVEPDSQANMVQVGDGLIGRVIDAMGQPLDRKGPIIAGGILVLEAAFQALGLQKLLVSKAAMREGILYDIVGRAGENDLRDESVAALSQRYGIDTVQADRVQDTALSLLEQVQERWKLDADDARMLGWAARLHELGLMIAHSGYHVHGSYVLEHSDIAGFSRQEQQMLAALVRSHRRSVTKTAFDALPERLLLTARRLAALLRLAVLLNRAHEDDPLPALELTADDNRLSLIVPQAFIDARPLLRADLIGETDGIAGLGIQFRPFVA